MIVRMTSSTTAQAPMMTVGCCCRLDDMNLYDWSAKSAGVAKVRQEAGVQLWILEPGSK